ncbi:hypothetical protein EDD15DRAFT_2192733 [Pisolithus albus]|nr:hypothetical protein EDD15DRAFT_2192733 [Pisolithus albus]
MYRDFPRPKHGSVSPCLAAAIRGALQLSWMWGGKDYTSRFAMCSTFLRLGMGTVMSSCFLTVTPEPAVKQRTEIRAAGSRSNYQKVFHPSPGWGSQGSHSRQRQHSTVFTGRCLSHATIDTLLQTPYQTYVNAGVVGNDGLMACRHCLGCNRVPQFGYAHTIWHISGKCLGAVSVGRRRSLFWTLLEANEALLTPVSSVKNCQMTD